MWLGGAKLWFLVTSYAITISLTHLLPADEYGSYYSISRLIAVPNMVIIFTVLFSVSRPLAAQYDLGCPDYSTLRARGIRLALVLGGPTMLVLLLAAPLLAQHVLAEPELANPLRVVAPISLVYALYAVNLGTLNAVRRFRRQALLDIFMAGSKAALIIAAAAAGLGLPATVAGFTLASILAFLLSRAMITGTGVAPTPTGPSQVAGSMASFAGQLIVFTAVTNLLQSVDVLLLKSFADTPLRDTEVGYYASAQQIALVPYSLMAAVSLLAFPLIAAIDQQREPERVRQYVSQTAKLTLVLLAFTSAIGSACSREVQALLFPSAYGEAADQLRLMVWGFSGYSFAVTIAWILNSAKRPRVAIALVAVPLATVAVGGYLVIPTMFTGGAAWAVAGAGLLAAIAAGIALVRVFDAGVPLVQLARIGACIGAVELLAWGWPTMATSGLVGKLLIVTKLGVLAMTFVGVALVVRATTVAEIKGLRRAK